MLQYPTATSTWAALGSNSCQKHHKENYEKYQNQEDLDDESTSAQVPQRQRASIGLHANQARFEDM